MSEKPGLTFNHGLELIGFQTTGPRTLTTDHLIEGDCLINTGPLNTGLTVFIYLFIAFNIGRTHS